MAIVHFGRTWDTRAINWVEDIGENSPCTCHFSSRMVADDIVTFYVGQTDWVNFISGQGSGKRIPVDFAEKLRPFVQLVKTLGAKPVLWTCHASGCYLEEKKHVAHLLDIELFADEDVGTHRLL